MSILLDFDRDICIPNVGIQAKVADLTPTESRILRRLWLAWPYPVHVNELAAVAIMRDGDSVSASTYADCENMMRTNISRIRSAFHDPKGLGKARQNLYLKRRLPPRFRGCYQLYLYDGDIVCQNGIQSMVSDLYDLIDGCDNEAQVRKAKQPWYAMSVEHKPFALEIGNEG